MLHYVLLLSSFASSFPLPTSLGPARSRADFRTLSLAKPFTFFHAIFEPSQLPTRFESRRPMSRQRPSLALHCSVLASAP